MSTIQRAKTGQTFWAVVHPSGDVPIVLGSHFGVQVDATPECFDPHAGMAYTTREGAEAHLATMPTHYQSGRPTGNVVALVRMGSLPDYWYYA